MKSITFTCDRCGYESNEEYTHGINKDDFSVQFDFDPSELSRAIEPPFKKHIRSTIQIWGEYELCANCRSLLAGKIHLALECFCTNAEASGIVEIESLLDSFAHESYMCVADENYRGAAKKRKEEIISKFRQLLTGELNERR